MAGHRLLSTCACAVGFAFSANYTNHAPMVAALRGEFHFNQVLAGLLTTGIFLTHAIMQIPGGHLVDRLGSRGVSNRSMAWVAVPAILRLRFPVAYWQLLAWKIFVGIGTGTCFVAGARYIHETLAGKKFHFAQGLYGGSILLGSGFVILAVPRISVRLGWRGAFLVSAAVAAAAWLLWTLAAPHAPQSAHPAGRFRDVLLSARTVALGADADGVVRPGDHSGYVDHRAAGDRFECRRRKAGLIGSFVLLLGIGMRPLGGALEGGRDCASCSPRASC